jgi:antitoxin component YwqK of YwqJK toxin-antitoxin module
LLSIDIGPLNHNCKILIKRFAFFLLLKKSINFTPDLKPDPGYMKYLSALLFLLIAFPNISTAQKIELINSGELIKKGIMLNDSGKYKNALSVYNQISRSDTNYVRVLYEKALTCEADSQFNQGLTYAQEGLSLKEQREYEPDLYTIYGNILDDLGKPEEAVKVFDSAIAKYPSYSLLYFNKGVALLALKRPHDAELLFQKTLMINPYMYSAHYQLGLAALKQGKIIPSFLSFIGYLLVNPSGKYWSKSINYLSQISKSTDEILDYKNKRATIPDANYQAVEDIVLSKIALDKGYKPIISLDDPISRQIQAVIEKLEYTPTDNDFWIQYYLPYFRQVYNDGKFEQFIFHSFSNVNIPVIQDYNKKNKKELGVFTGDAGVYFDQLRSTRELFYKKRDSVIEKYFVEEGKLVGKGVLINNGKTLTGRWEFYYPAGNIKSWGIYNEMGKREGEWPFYFSSGRLKAKEHYKNGNLEGEQDYYFENGNLSSHENYVNNQPEGLIITYYYAGNKKSITNYKLGKKDGEAREFYSNGNLSSVNNYTNGILTDISHEYYKSGPVKEIEQYNNGKAEGTYKSYHEGGGLSTEGQNTKDNGQGEWKYYYESGKLKEKRNYINDTEEGIHEEYYENGQISRAYIAKKGKINGELTEYNKVGKVLSKSIYDNGIVRSAKYFDRSGLQLSSTVIKDNFINVVSYTPDGLKKAHFGYDQKGQLGGIDTIFYPSGKINQLKEYKNGELNGNYISYYLNGNKKSEINMTDGKANGYYTSFYVDGKTETEGWVIEGRDQGEWDYYDEQGKISAKYYYLDDDLNGYKEEYLSNGQKTLEQKYHRGWLEKMTQYDSSGKIIAVDSFPKASGKYNLIYPNGQIMARGNYVNGDFDGPYKTYFFDGSVESSVFYNKGLKDSTYSSFYYGGAKNKEGHYKYGNKSGIWKFYNEEGKLNSTEEYANDMMNGKRIYYFPNGNKDFVSIYKDDLLDGIAEKYDPEGVLAYQTIFDQGDMKSYSYLGKDGKILPFIPVASNNGILKSYFPNGKLSRECSYSDGIKNGRDIIYFDNGQVWTVDTTAYGIVGGISREYYKNGKIKSEYQYITDNATGICREFNDKGTLKKEITFENGVNHGPTKYYNENGKLTKTMVYHYGTLISAKNEN